MDINGIVNRIEARLAEIQRSPRAISLEAGLSGDAIRNWQRSVRTDKADAGMNTSSLAKVADALEVPLAWLMTGAGPATFEQRDPGLSEPPGNYAMMRALERLDNPQAPAPAHEPDVKIGVHGRFAQIIATVDKPGLAKLRARLDAIEALMDD